MKIKSILSIFMALVVVACSTAGNDRNNNSNISGNNSNDNNNGGTPAPDENLDLGLERAQLNVYTSLLNGEVQTRLGTIDSFGQTRSTDYFRLETTRNTFPTIASGGIPAQATLTNDMVQDIAFNATSIVPFLTIKTVVTRRGGVAGSFAKRFWSNDVVLLEAGDYVATVANPTSFLDENGQTITAPAGYTAYNLSKTRVFTQVKTAVINQQDQTTSLSDWRSNGQNRQVDILMNASDTQISIIFVTINSGVARYRDGVVHTYAAVN